MEIITIESGAYKTLVEKIDNIEKYVIEKSNEDVSLKDKWVDSYEVCKYLRISSRTLQRLRSNKTVSYSVVGGKCYYSLSEIERVIKEKVIRCSDERINDLIIHYNTNSLK